MRDPDENPLPVVICEACEKRVIDIPGFYIEHECRRPGSDPEDDSILIKVCEACSPNIPPGSTPWEVGGYIKRQADEREAEKARIERERSEVIDKFNKGPWECTTCGHPLNTREEITAHASATGHGNFRLPEKVDPSLFGL